MTFRQALALPVWFVQVALSLVGMGIRWFDRTLYTKYLYYQVTVLKRMIAGEPLWKPIDWNIGIAPPKNHPLGDPLAPLKLSPEQEARFKAIEEKHTRVAQAFADDRVVAMANEAATTDFTKPEFVTIAKTWLDLREISTEPPLGMPVVVQSPPICRCAFCDVTLPHDDHEAISDHALTCAAHPLVLENERLRVEMARLLGEKAS